VKEIPKEVEIQFPFVDSFLAYNQDMTLINMNLNDEFVAIISGDIISSIKWDYLPTAVLN